MRWSFGGVFLVCAVQGCGPQTVATTPTGVTTPPATTAPVNTAAVAGASATPPAVTPPTAAGQPNTVPTPPPAIMPPATQTPPGVMPPAAPTGGAPKVDFDECNLKTKWQGDNVCITPPPPDKGFQLHVGPSNYENPEAKYILPAGGEVTESFTATSSNTEEIYYYFRQYRMRPGSHHMILNSTGPQGRRIGGSQNPAWDEPQGGVIAPENKGVGMKLGPKTSFNVNLHYFNFTDKPILKEVWLNFWYRDAKDVTEPAKELFALVPMNVAPGQHVLLSGTCPIRETGHILTLYGHRHANNLRFAVWRERAGKRDLVLDDYNWEEPALFQYSSTIMNTAPNPAMKVAGGWTGILDVKAGDNLIFDCEIINKTNATFRGQNEAKDDEMCILVGDTVGVQVPTSCTPTTKLI